MTDLREKLADIIYEKVYGKWQDEDGHETAADAIIAALPDMVVPLVWRGHNEVGHGRCNYGFGAFGHWYAVSKAGKLWNCMTYVDCKPFQIGYFQTKDEAQAAANAHHRATILAAFGVQGET